MLSIEANSAAAAGQMAARLVLIFSATFRAHPIHSSAKMQVTSSFSVPLIFSISSSSFPGMTLKIACDNFPRSFQSSPGSIPSGRDTRLIRSPILSLFDNAFMTRL
ncbi:hypothetical protein LguiA_006297 [Lonicera macranthoides]